MNIYIKKCKSSNCGEKPLTDFYFDKRNGKNGGYSSYCKICKNIKSMQYQEENPQSKKKASSKYYKNNKDKIAEYNSNYDSRDNQKRFYNKNKDKFFKYKKERRKIDPKFRLTENIRKRIYSYIKNKPQNSINYLGCNIDFYKDYLESQFDEFMTWENYGKDGYWEIDHIKPLFTFDFSLHENILKAFHYLNTRPLSIVENRSRPKNKIK